MSKEKTQEKTKGKETIRTQMEKATFLDGKDIPIEKWGPGLDNETEVTDDRNPGIFIKYRWIPRLNQMETEQEAEKMLHNFYENVPLISGTREERELLVPAFIQKREEIKHRETEQAVDDWRRAAINLRSWSQDSEYGDIFPEYNTGQKNGGKRKTRRKRRKKKRKTKKRKSRRKLRRKSRRKHKKKHRRR